MSLRIDFQPCQVRLKDGSNVEFQCKVSPYSADFLPTGYIPALFDIRIGNFYFPLVIKPEEQTLYGFYRDRIFQAMNDSSQDSAELLSRVRKAFEDVRFSERLAPYHVINGSPLSAFVKQLEGS